MRRLIGLVMVASLTLVSAVSFALEVTQVIFYPSSATVVEEGQVVAKNGSVDLGYLPESAQVDSLRLTLDKPLALASTKAGKVERDPALTKMREDLQVLEIREEALKLQVNFLKSLLDLKNNKAWEDLPIASAYKRLDNVVKRIATLTLQQSKLKDQTKRKKESIDHWRQGHAWRVMALVEGVGETQARFVYGVSQAGWHPYYQAYSEGHKLTFLFSARVWQNTGNEWKGVRVALSTTRPWERVTPPQPQPIYLRPVEPIRILKKVPNVMTLKGTGKALAPEAAYQPLEGAAIYKPHGLLSSVSGKKRILKVKMWSLTPRLKRLSCPAQDQAVYIVAQVGDLGQILPPGPLEVHQGSSLGGKMSLPSLIPLKIPFGRDQTMKVKRELVKRFLDEKFGGKVEITLSYRTTIINQGSDIREVEVVEAVPVSQDERIKVKFKGAEPEIHPSKKGFLKWKIKVPPRGKAQVSYSFSVKYPKGIRLNHPF